MSADPEELERHAAALAETYRRHTWYRFVMVFVPVPFAVLLFRLHLDYWHYYLAGAAYLLFSIGLFKYDNTASAKVDAALNAANAARETSGGTHLIH